MDKQAGAADIVTGSTRSRVMCPCPGHFPGAWWKGVSKPVLEGGWG